MTYCFLVAAPRLGYKKCLEYKLTTTLLTDLAVHSKVIGFSEVLIWTLKDLEHKDPYIGFRGNSCLGDEIFP